MAHEWAKRGLAAVRVAYRDDTTQLRSGPVPVAGRALTWFLNLDKREDKRFLKEYAEEYKPNDLWTSPSCRVFCSVQRINRRQFSIRKEWRPRGEKQAFKMLYFCRALHRDQQFRGGRSHHEQSASSRMPFDGEEWPYAVHSRDEYQEHCAKV